MARPRTPSKVLELRGSFDKNPKRRRKDAEGTGEFNVHPPAHLPQESVAAWTWLVKRLPRITMYSTDELAVEIAARLLARWWLDGDMETLKELRLWLGKLGFTPRDRTELPSAPDRPSDNRFAGFGRRK